MQSFFISIGNLISNVWDMVMTTISNFFGLFRALGSYITFVQHSLAILPALIRVPCTIILTVMVIKFFLNLGKS